MQFRQNGKIVRLIRAGHDAAKRPTTEILGRLVRPGLELDDQVRSKLTAQEIDEVAAFIADARRSSAVEQEHAAQNLARSIELATEWLESADPARARAFAAETQRSVKKLRRAIELAQGSASQPKAPG